jgi:hypothetical protein
MAGTVQHGASTLPLEKFNQFPPVGCIEIHLATEFQNIIYRQLPREFVRTVDDWIGKNLKDEFGAGDSVEQSLYKLRKKAWGPFKKEFWKIDPKLYVPALEERLEKMFRLLNVAGTAPAVDKQVKPASTLPPRPAVLGRP